MTPSQLRKDILGKRNNLTPQELKKKSSAVRDRLLAMDQVREKKNIFVYVSFRSEVMTFSLIEDLLRMDKTVTVPITRTADNRLDAIRITDLERDLVPGYCNIPEPTKQLCKQQLMSPQTIDTVLLPGSVFDERGGRFGYGGGYYDRFVSKIPHAARIGLAFDLQIVDKAPLQDHDELLDFVVTESRTIRGQR
ncbi:5-formyltetrahydrofolate cyclo-ligase [Desulforhopalus singaporensis]|uniref:5-formyltetrahydrofolate cyclo-ligase n=1 Tax=Desulforhopalus singaporensis TaxID=91360 RepID=A0A1H0TNC6_9BACT|nr:5-formyltetrahydrofolate cyclo-ligase [Desulforhopalus singaporensis]SDP55433.1 5-formyltetrahydrofolate cyclo-ligase [Desulforhopalus singaporensis]